MIPMVYTYTVVTQQQDTMKSGWSWSSASRERTVRIRFTDAWCALTL